MNIRIAKLARITSLGLLFSTATSVGQVKFERTFAPAEHGFVHEIERPFREEVCLNGSWDFQAVPVPATFVRMKWNPPALSEPTK